MYIYALLSCIEHYFVCVISALSLLLILQVKVSLVNDYVCTIRRACTPFVKTSDVTCSLSPTEHSSQYWTFSPVPHTLHQGRRSDTALTKIKGFESTPPEEVLQPRPLSQLTSRSKMVSKRYNQCQQCNFTNYFPFSLLYDFHHMVCESNTWFLMKRAPLPP